MEVLDESLLENKQNTLVDKKSKILKSKFTLCLDRGCKRTIDILGSLCGIVALIPIICVVWICNKINKDNGPIFYTKERIGKDGKLFKMYKFRTMVVNADELLYEYLNSDEKIREEYTKYKKLRNDPRVTKIGHFLRKTSLDEFPQFINVLKGEMSLVGPRPYLERELPDIGLYYNYIIKSKPGITGLWQVSGRSETTFKDRLDLDVEYYKNNSCKEDVKILFKTVEQTVMRKGAM